MTPQDYDAQLALMLAMRASLDRLYDGVRAVRSVRAQARELLDRMEKAGLNAAALKAPAEALAAKLTAVENDLMQPKNQADQDVENFPTKIDNQLAYVYGLVGETDAKPTDGQVERYRDLETELDAVLARLQKILEEDVAAFNAAAEAAGAAPVIPPR